MCVIVHVGAKKSISRELLNNCYSTNPHGWGIMWAKDGKLQMVKEVSNFDQFYKIWIDVPRDAERAIHFRIKTHGEINKANCHPFRPAANIGLMHNGIIDTHLIDDKMSDTHNYCEYELKPIMAKWPDCLTSAAFEKVVKDNTGYSKLLFMDNMGKVLKIRENVWSERNGCYFSNASSLNYTYTGFGRSRGHYHDIDSYSYPDNDKPLILTKPEDWRPNKYDPLNADKEPVSDMFSGNKTETEGQKFVREQEERKLKRLAEAAGETGSTAEDEQDEQEEEADEDADFVSFVPELDDVMTMTDGDVIDWISDCPKSAMLFIQSLCGTLFQAGIVDIATANLHEEVTKAAKKSAAG